MKLRFFIFTLLFLGLFCVPMKGYACATIKSTHKISTSKCESSKTQKQTCCENHSNKKSNPCSGKCGSTKCLTSCTSFNLFLNIEFTFESSIFENFIQKTTFYYVDPFVSTGHVSIWLPPKII
jgi:hypothetical protein